MLSRDKKKPHRVKWAEAERELVIRGIALPNNAARREYVPPRISKQTDPNKVRSNFIPR